MDQFYKLMVKDSLDREDVENMEKEKMRSSYEIVQLFRDSNGIYHSFISESVIQLILGAIVDLVLIWVMIHGDLFNLKIQTFNNNHINHS